MSNKEQTLSIIKPDACERNLSDKIKAIFSKNNLSILNSKNFIFQKMKRLNFIKFINLSHFMTNFVIIYPLDQ